MEEALRLIHSDDDENTVYKLHIIDFTSLTDEEKRTIYLIAVTRDGSLLRKVPDPLLTQEICDIAVQNYPHSLLKVPPRFINYDVCLNAVMDDYINEGGLLYVFLGKKILSEEDKHRLCIDVLRYEGHCINIMGQYLETLTPKERYPLYLQAVTTSWESLILVPDGFKTVNLCIRALEQNVNAIEFIPPRVKSDPDFLNRVAPLTHHPHERSTIDLSRLNPDLYANHQDFFDSIHSRKSANVSGLYKRLGFRPGRTLHGFLGGKRRKKSTLKR